MKVAFIAGTEGISSIVAARMLELNTEHDFTFHDFGARGTMPKKDVLSSIEHLVDFNSPNLIVLDDNQFINELPLPGSYTCTLGMSNPYPLKPIKEVKERKYPETRRERRAAERKVNKQKYLQTHY